MNKEFYQNRIAISPIFWGSRRKERDIFFFTSQIDTPKQKKKKPPLFSLYRYLSYRFFSVSGGGEKRDYGPIEEKKRVSHQRETKNNLSQRNRKGSTLNPDPFIGGKPTHDREIKGGDVKKGRKENWSPEKKGVLDRRESKNNLSQRNRKESSLFGFKESISKGVIDGKPSHDGEIKGGDAKKGRKGNWSPEKKGVLNKKDTKNNLFQRNKKESSVNPNLFIGGKPSHDGEIKGGDAKKGRKGNWSLEKKGVLNKKETKINHFSSNTEKSSVDFKIIGVEKAAHDIEIKDGNVKKKKPLTVNSKVVGAEKRPQKRRIKGSSIEKKKNDFRSREKKAVSDIKEETFNKARAGLRFSTLVKNTKMDSKKKYGHRVKVIFGRARGSLKALFLKFWKRGVRKQRFQKIFLFLTRKGKLKRKLYRNIKISKQLFTVGKKRIVTSKHLLRAKKIEYRKYKKRRRRPKNRIIFKMPPGGKKGLIALKGSYNNIILTLTDTEGNTKAWVSAGTAGFKNGQKSSHFAAETAVERLVDKSVEIGYQFVKVKMKGMGGGKLKAIRRLCKCRLKLIGISDHFLIPHNGCRRARKPRN